MYKTNINAVRKRTKFMTKLLHIVEMCKLGITLCLVNNNNDNDVSYKNNYNIYNS